MKGKSNPLKPDLKFALQSFNTPGNEIAPGSDIIRKNLYHGNFRHAAPNPYKNGWPQRTTQQNEEIEGGSQTTTSILT